MEETWAREREGLPSWAAAANPQSLALSPRAHASSCLPHGLCTPSLWAHAGSCSPVDSSSSPRTPDRQSLPARSYGPCQHACTPQPEPPRPLAAAATSASSVVDTAAKGPNCSEQETTDLITIWGTDTEVQQQFDWVTKAQLYMAMAESMQERNHQCSGQQCHVKVKALWA